MAEFDSFSSLHRLSALVLVTALRQHAEAMLVEMQLHELRKARQATQVDVAEAMNVEQAAVSKLERREDMYVSTLREYVKALGGELKLVASFPDVKFIATHEQYDRINVESVNDH
jgi:transcriptional regulator with XRE-family HTH domain